MFNYFDLVIEFYFCHCVFVLWFLFSYIFGLLLVHSFHFTLVKSSTKICFSTQVSVSCCFIFVIFDHTHLPTYIFLTSSLFHSLLWPASLVWLVVCLTCFYLTLLCISLQHYMKEKIGGVQHDGTKRCELTKLGLTGIHINPYHFFFIPWYYLEKYFINDVFMFAKFMMIFFLLVPLYWFDYLILWPWLYFVFVVSFFFFYGLLQLFSHNLFFLSLNIWTCKLSQTHTLLFLTPLSCEFLLVESG